MSDVVSGLNLSATIRTWWYSEVQNASLNHDCNRDHDHDVLFAGKVRIRLYIIDEVSVGQLIRPLG